MRRLFLRGIDPILMEPIKTIHHKKKQERSFDK